MSTVRKIRRLIEIGLPDKWIEPVMEVLEEPDAKPKKKRRKRRTAAQMAAAKKKKASKKKKAKPQT